MGDDKAGAALHQAVHGGLDALFCAGVKPAAALYCGVRSNLLALAAGTLNAGLEIMVAPHYSFEIAAL